MITLPLGSVAAGESVTGRAGVGAADDRQRRGALSLMMCLKCCQRLGYFARFDEVPASIAGHLRQELGLHESVDPAN